MDAVKMPPNIGQNPMALALWARSLYFKDRFDEAFEAGLAAVELAPRDCEVRDLVASALSAGVAPYHNQMLKDAPRNRAYARALETAIRPGMRVLEIGTGAGLLALIAAKAGAEVFTCERNAVAAAAARVIAERNALADRIHVIPKRSAELTIGKDLPGPADLLVSEIFGQRLFNEGVIDSVADAKARLLKPAATIIPPRAELRCALVASATKVDRAEIGIVEGFDLSAVNVLARPSNEWLECKRDHAQRRSRPESALAKAFRAEPPFGDDVATVELVSEGGEVNGVAQWLRIDFGGGNVLENDPFSDEHSHWGSPITLFPRPINTVPGQTIVVKLRRIGETLLISLAPQPS